MDVIGNLIAGLVAALPASLVPAVAPEPPVTSIHFRADWSRSVDGVIEAGRPVLVDYDPARLPRCRDTYMARPAWQIDLRYRFDDGPELHRTLSDGAGGVVPRAVDVPAGARTMRVWFRVFGQRTGCTAFDSDYGRDYLFAVTPPGP